MPSSKYSPLRNMNDEDAVTKIISDYKQALADKRQDITRNHRYRLIYLALDDPSNVVDESSGQIKEDKRLYSNTYLPIGAASVDTAATQLWNQIFSTPRYFEIDADDFMDDLKALKVTAHLMKRHREMKFRTKIYSVLQGMLCYDYYVTMTRWLMRPGYVPTTKSEVRYETMGGMKIPYSENKTVMEYRANAVDRSDIELIDYFSCAHDKGAKAGFEDSQFFVDWRDISLDELVALQENKDRPWGRYKNIDSLLENIEQGGNSEIDRDDTDPSDRGRKPKSNKIKVVRYWTHDEVIEVAKDLCISRNKLDGMPLQLWKTYPRTAEFAGMGILQRLERMQLDINAIINLKRDFQNLVLHPPAAISSDLTGFEEGDIELYPGKTFRVTNGLPKDKISFYQPQVNPIQGATEELATQIQMTQQSTGLGDNAMGTYSASRNTAREASAVAAGMISKVVQMASRLEESCVEEIYIRQFILEQMNLTKEERFRYLGAEGEYWMVVKPEDYRWNSVPRFSAKGSWYLGYREMYIAQFFKAMQTASAFPQLHNWDKILAKMWQLLDPDDFMHFIKDPRQKTHNIPPAYENSAMAHGILVEVSQENDHRDHLRVHMLLKATPDFQVWPPQRKLQLEQHIVEHQQMMTAPLGQQMGGPIMGSPGGGRPQDTSDVDRGLRGTAEGIA